MSTGIRIYIVEDEIITAASMEQVLVQAGYVVTGMADDAEAALREMERNPPDFVILDVHLAGRRDGIWLAEQINSSLRIPFIFVTAQGDRETIRAASQTRPFGYLIKPFLDEDIFTSIDNALRNYSRNEPGEEPSHAATSQMDSLVIRDALFVKNGNLFVKINIADILFFQSDKNYVDIFTEGRKYASRTALKDIAQHITEDYFIQVNRSVIINVHKIDAIGTYSIHIKEHEITLSDNYKDALLNRIRFLGG